MIRLTRSQVQPIGIDVGFDSVKMLQLEVVTVADVQSLSVVAAVRHPLPDETRDKPELRLPMAMKIVREQLREGKFVGKRVVAALPRDILQVKNLRLPSMPPAEVQSAVEFEARNIFTFHETEEIEVRYLNAGEVRQGADARQELIALGVRREDIDNFVEQLHRGGVVIESLDLEPTAIYRTVERFMRRREDEQEVHVLVDIGARRTEVVIGRGHDISFYKSIDIGCGHLHDAVSKKLGITSLEAKALRRRLIETPSETTANSRDPVRQAVFDATRSTMEDLGRELSLCLRYYSVTFRGHRPLRVRLLGGESGDAQLLSTLGAALPVAVEAGRPLHSVNTSAMKQSDRRGFMGEWAVAFGLGLKMTQGHFGARDGKARDPNAPKTKPAAEVVDLSQAIEQGAADRSVKMPEKPLAARSSAASPSASEEVLHA